MRFSHTADCHVGGHRDPRLRALTEAAFTQFITESLQYKVDFILIAGDLFNTAIPGIDTLKLVVTQLGRAKHAGIPVYAIPGSHDFSPSGKTMLDVLEEAQLLLNVCRGTVTADGKLKLDFTVDKKTSAKITGVIGRRGMLDRAIYDDLDRSIEHEPGMKVFLFHTAITELKPTFLQEMESTPVSFLPSGFAYYAGGHVHITERYDSPTHKNVIYPGPLFPNSFSELERLQHGSYVLYDNGDVLRKPIVLKRVLTLRLRVDGMAGHDAAAKLHDLVQHADATDAIVLLRIDGDLAAGSPNDLNVRDAVERLEQDAYAVLRHTIGVTAPEFTALGVRADEPQHVTEALLREHADQLRLGSADGTALVRELLHVLSQEPKEGEKLYEYQERVIREAQDRLQ